MHAVKSFYSLDYTEEGLGQEEEGQEGGPPPSEQVPEEDGSSRLEDYNKIIQELQSHRKEIEKLQITGGSTAQPPPTSSTVQTGCENQSKHHLSAYTIPAFPDFYRLVTNLVECVFLTFYQAYFSHQQTIFKQALLAD